MNKEILKKYYDNGILKAFLDGKIIEYQYGVDSCNEWRNVSNFDIFNSANAHLRLRIKPEPIKQTLEWFKFSECQPNVENKEIICSDTGGSIIVKLTNTLYVSTYNGIRHFPLLTDYWAYLNTPDDEIPF